MRMNCCTRFGSALLLLIGVSLMHGCSGHTGNPEGDLDPAKKHILNASRVYNAYSSAHQGKAPRSMEQIKKWVNGLSKADRKKFGVEDVTDDTYVSPRDHKEYKVHADTRRMKMGPAPLVVYEDEGVNGQRLGAGQQGNTFTMDQNRLDTLLNQK